MMISVSLEEDQINKVFDFFDKDKSNFITPEEILLSVNKTDRSTKGVHDRDLAQSIIL